MARTGRLFLMIGLLGLTACSGQFLPATGIPTQTPPSPTETPTTVWFPPTSTPTAFLTSTAAPAQAQPPGMGSLLFSDPFDQPAFWNRVTSSSASATVEQGQLILSVNGAGPAMILSLRSEPTLTDFYAEATADLKLCRGNDQYGLIFRAATGNNHYQFVLNCNGQMRLERVRSGQVEPLLDWTSSGDLPPSAPSEVRLGVWSAGKEMRFYLNDHYQFSARDPVLPAGTLGFFVKASGTTPALVGFSNLSVYSLSLISLTQTVIPGWAPTP